MSSANHTTTAHPKRERRVPPTVPPALRSINDSAAYLGISRAKLYRLVREGRLQAVRLDGRRLVRVAELDAFIAGLGR